MVHSDDVMAEGRRQLIFNIRSDVQINKEHQQKRKKEKTEGSGGSKLPIQLI